MMAMSFESNFAARNRRRVRANNGPFGPEVDNNLYSDFRLLTPGC
jgi:hypothetical protein